MNFITQNLGNIVVGSLVVIILFYALRSLIRSFRHCSCRCADCPNEIAKDCHCHIKEESNEKKE